MYPTCILPASYQISYQILPTVDQLQTSTGGRMQLLVSNVFLKLQTTTKKVQTLFFCVLYYIRVFFFSDQNLGLTNLAIWWYQNADPYPFLRYYFVCEDQHERVWTFGTVKSAQRTNLHDLTCFVSPVVSPISDDIPLANPIIVSLLSKTFNSSLYCWNRGIWWYQYKVPCTFFAIFGCWKNYYEIF